MKKECKCHGVSGSCTTRTCWNAMQEFRRVGDYLKMKYNGATQVMMKQSGKGLVVANKNHKGPTKSDLVYLENSPDYCLQDYTTGKRIVLFKTRRLAKLGFYLYLRKMSLSKITPVKYIRQTLANCKHIFSESGEDASMSERGY